MRVEVQVKYEGFTGTINGDVDKRIFIRLWLAMLRVIELVSPKREVILAPDNSIKIGKAKEETCPSCHGFRKLPTGSNMAKGLEYHDCPECHGTGVK